MARLTRCICGASDGERYEHAGLALIKCACGTARRDGELEDYEEQYRSGDYHRSETRHNGCTPYAERYSHDLQIAALRWARYGRVLGAKLGRVRASIDVGCANGAFVDYLRSFGVNAWGLEPAPAFASERIIAGTLADLGANAPKDADLVTYHDVLEHVCEPEHEVVLACSALAKSGLLIIDVPNVWDGRGDHHYKLEHLWYFGEEALVQMIRMAGLLVLAVDHPIPGKLVVYAEAPG